MADRFHQYGRERRECSSGHSCSYGFKLRFVWLLIALRFYSQLRGACAQTCVSTPITPPSTAVVTFEHFQSISFDLEAHTDDVYIQDFAVVFADAGTDIAIDVWVVTDGTAVMAEVDGDVNWRVDERWHIIATAFLADVVANQTYNLGLLLNHPLAQGGSRGFLLYSNTIFDTTEASTGESRFTNNDISVHPDGGGVNDFTGVVGMFTDKQLLGDVCYSIGVVVPEPPSPAPSPAPTSTPTGTPTSIPTPLSTFEPTATPTIMPTPVPTFEPTAAPTSTPTPLPTSEPTVTPTSSPTPLQTSEPTAAPTSSPTRIPTTVATLTPTPLPTPLPTNEPSPTPASTPTPPLTTMPTPIFTNVPSSVPTVAPTPLPTLLPSDSSAPSETSSTDTMTTGTTTAPPPLPATEAPAERRRLEIVSVRLSPSGAECDVRFETDTDRGGVPLGAFVPCEDFFTPETVAFFGSSPRCRWPALAQLTVSLAGNASHPPTLSYRDDPNSASTAARRIVFSPSVVISPADEGDNSSVLLPFDGSEGQARYVVDLPDTLDIPVAGISVPSSVTTCDQLFVDARFSLPAFVGRSPLFHYESNCAILPSASSSPTELPSFTLITSDATLTIPPSVLAGYFHDVSSTGEAITCRVSVVAENFMGARSESVGQDVVISALPMQLSALMRGVPPSGVWTRSQELRLFAQMLVGGCNATDPSAATLRLLFQWSAEERRGDGTTAVVSFPDDVDTTKSVLALQGLLEAGSTYTLSVLVTPVPGSTSPDQLIEPLTVVTPPIFIQPSPIRALIAGPQRRVWPATRDLVLDASGSFDPDDPNAELDFQWTCTIIDGGESPCSPDGIQPSGSDSQGSGLLVVPSELGITPIEVGGRSSIEGTVRIDLVVSRISNGVAEHSSANTASTLVEIVADVVPVVTITGKTSLAIDETLRLEGLAFSSEISPQDGIDRQRRDRSRFEYTWQDVSGQIDLPSLVDSSEFIDTSSRHRNLVIEPGLLEAGRVYTFELSAVDTLSGLVGRASVDVRIAHGPIITDFVATRIDDDTQNLYTIEATAFVADASLAPIQYRFMYRELDVNQDDADSRPAPAPRVICECEFSSALEYTSLPSGLLEIIVEATDSADHISTATSTITVPDLNDTPCETRQLDTILESLGGANSLGQNSRATYLVSLAARHIAEQNSEGCQHLFLDYRSALLGVLSDMNDNGFFHRWHAEQLGFALTRLTANTPRVVLDSTLVLTERLVDFAREFVALEQLPRASAVVDLAVEVLSNLLEYDLSDECEHAQTAWRLLQELFALDLDPLLPGEAPAMRQRRSAFAGSTVRADVTESGVGVMNNVDSSNFPFATNITLTDESGTQFTSNALTVISLSSHLSACFRRTTITPHGDVTSIVLTGRRDSLPSGLVEAIGATQSVQDAESEVSQNDGVIPPDDTEVEIEEGLTAEFVLVYPLSPPGGCDAGVSLECGFHNETLDEWSTDGCFEVSRTEAGDFGLLFCQCDHLTTFAVLRGLREVDDNAVAAGSECGAGVIAPNSLGPREVVTAYAFIGAFVLVTLYAITQARKFFYRDAILFHIVGLRTNHMHMFKLIVPLVLLQCLCQVTWLVVYVTRSHDDAQSLVMISVFSSMARVSSYWVFAVMTFQWTLLASVTPTDVRRARRIMSAGVVIVTLALMALAVCFAVVDVNSEAFEVVGEIGSIGMFVLNVATLAALFGSSSHLVRSVQRASKEAGVVVSNAATSRLIKIALLFCFIFAAESAIILISGVSYSMFTSHFLIFQSVYLALNLASAVIVLWMSRSIYEGYIRKEKARKESQKGRNPKTSTSSGAGDGDEKSVQPKSKFKRPTPAARTGSPSPYFGRSASPTPAAAAAAGFRREGEAGEPPRSPSLSSRMRAAADFPPPLNANGSGDALGGAGAFAGPGSPPGLAVPSQPSGASNFPPLHSAHSSQSFGSRRNLLARQNTSSTLTSTSTLLPTLSDAHLSPPPVGRQAALSVTPVRPTLRPFSESDPGRRSPFQYLASQAAASQVPTATHRMKLAQSASHGNVPTSPFSASPTRRSPAPTFTSPPHALSTPRRSPVQRQLFTSTLSAGNLHAHNNSTSSLSLNRPNIVRSNTTNSPQRRLFSPARTRSSNRLSQMSQNSFLTSSSTSLGDMFPASTRVSPTSPPRLSRNTSFREQNTIPVSIRKTAPGSPSTLLSEGGGSRTALVFPKAPPPLEAFDPTLAELMSGEVGNGGDTPSPTPSLMRSATLLRSDNFTRSNTPRTLSSTPGLGGGVLPANNGSVVSFLRDSDHRRFMNVSQASLALGSEYSYNSSQGEGEDEDGEARATDSRSSVRRRRRSSQPQLKRERRFTFGRDLSSRDIVPRSRTPSLSTANTALNMT